MRNSEHNIYDTILTGMIALLIFGTFGNGAQPIRLAALALTPFMLIQAWQKPSRSMAYYRYECFFLFTWFAWSAGFLYKSMEMAESVKHLIYLFVHILCFFEMLWAASKAKNPQRAVCMGWLILLIVSIPIAFWEITGASHLPTTVMEDSSIGYGDLRIERPFAAVTFGNLNSYNTVICWALPFLCFFALFPEKRRDNVLSLCTILPLLLVVVINSSRGAIICLSILILNYIRCYLKVGKHKSVMLTIVIVVTFVLSYYLYELFFFIIGRFTEQGMSDDGRSENIVKGLQALFDSGGLGLGVGNYSPVMDRVYEVSIPAPHNIFLDVLVVFGIPVFIGFMGMVLRMFLMSRCNIRRNRYFFSFAIVSLVLGGMVDSAYIQKATTWVFLVSCYILVDSRYNPVNPLPEK